MKDTNPLTKKGGPRSGAGNGNGNGNGHGRGHKAGPVVRARTVRRAAARKATKEAKTAGVVETAPVVASAPAAAPVRRPSLMATQMAALQPQFNKAGDNYDRLGLNYVGDAPVIEPGTDIVVLNLDSLKKPELVAFMEELLLSGESSPYAVQLEPALQALRLRTNSLATAVTVQGSMAEQAAAATRDANTEVSMSQEELRQYARLVQNFTKGNGTVIHSLGLATKRAPTKAGELPFPQGLKVNPGPVTGVLVLSCAIVPRSRGYLGRCSPDVMPRVWSGLKMSNTPKFTVSDLESGKGYVFQVAAAGGKTGQSDWSPEVGRVCA